MLVNTGAIIELIDDEGCIPLLTAAQFGYVDIVQFFIHRGTNIKLCGDFQIQPPLMVAYFSGYTKFINFCTSRFLLTTLRDLLWWTKLIS
ncbi:hypothetical protein PHMEG_00014358 [Phytophthora megakarya]|uniref:Uncharacterized protein n=1 Tax=Phytophthora megakarya TaxID=4795 RepID=A0A225W3Z7_9STRA|nr:hypothetical protein PHMEG_00014358 [Phytophthora megakarya]